MNEVPDHIRKVNIECIDMYNAALNQGNLVERLFDTNRRSLDMELASIVFEELAYAEIFKNTGGNIEVLNSKAIYNSTYDSVLSQWPGQYYLRKLREEKIIDHISTGRNRGVYLVNKEYAGVVNDLLISD